MSPVPTTKPRLINKSVRTRLNILKHDIMAFVLWNLSKVFHKSIEIHPRRIDSEGAMLYREKCIETKLTNINCF